VVITEKVPTSYIYTVCYGDTDAGGVVYFANYLRMCERSWYFYLKQRGWDLAAAEKDGLYLTVKQVEATYKAPARYGMTLEIITTLQETGRASLWFHHEIRNQINRALLAEVRNQMVAINASGKLQRFPRDLQKVLQRK